MKFIKGKYHKYIKYGGRFYLYKKITNDLPIIIESLKPLFKVYTGGHRIIKDGRKKYLCWPLESDQLYYYEPMPYNRANYNPTQELINLLFFRYVLNINTRMNQILVFPKENGYHFGTIAPYFMRTDPQISGYYITDLKVENAINPEFHISQILGLSNQLEIELFLIKIENVIKSINRNYLYLYNCLRENLKCLS